MPAQLQVVVDPSGRGKGTAGRRAVERGEDQELNRGAARTPPLAYGELERRTNGGGSSFPPNGTFREGGHKSMTYLEVIG